MFFNKKKKKSIPEINQDATPYTQPTEPEKDLEPWLSLMKVPDVLPIAEDVIKVLDLNGELATEVSLIFNMANDQGLLLGDWRDLKAICSYLLDGQEDLFKQYCFNKRNIQTIMRQAVIAESKGLVITGDRYALSFKDTLVHMIDQEEAILLLDPEIDFDQQDYIDAYLDAAQNFIGDILAKYRSREAKKLYDAVVYYTGAGLQLEAELCGINEHAVSYYFDICIELAYFFVYSGIYDANNNYRSIYAEKAVNGQYLKIEIPRGLPPCNIDSLRANMNDYNTKGTNDVLDYFTATFTDRPVHKSVTQSVPPPAMNISGANTKEKGVAFEDYCADLLIKNGFKNVRTTKGSGDHGVDILAENMDTTYAIQCKNYSGSVGNSAVEGSLQRQTVLWTRCGCGHDKQCFHAAGRGRS